MDSKKILKIVIAVVAISVLAIIGQTMVSFDAFGASWKTTMGLPQTADSIQWQLYAGGVFVDSTGHNGGADWYTDSYGLDTTFSVGVDTFWTVLWLIKWAGMTDGNYASWPMERDERIVGTLDVNVAQISGGAGAADSLEAILDGNSASLNLSALRIIPTSPLDTAVVIESDSSDVAMIIRGSDKVARSEFYALEVVAGDSGSGVLMKGGSGAATNELLEGVGLMVQSALPNSDNQAGAYIRGGSDGMIIAGLDASGADGLVIHGNGSSAIVLQSGAGSTDPLIDFAPTASVRHTDLVLDSANFSKQVYDTIGTVASDSVWAKDTSDVPAAAAANLAMGDMLKDTIAYQAPSTISGSGSEVVTIFAVDTSGTDDTLQNVSVTIRTLSTSFVAGPLSTNASGFVSFNLDPDSFLTVSSRIGYIFPLDTIVVSGTDTFAVEGYDTPVSLPSDPSLAQVVGDVTRIQGVIGMNVYGMQIFAQNSFISVSKPGVDSTGGSKLILPITAQTTTDSTGRWTLNLIKSSEYVDTTRGFYKIWGTMPGSSDEIFKFDRLYLTGNINLGDSLLTK